MRLPQIGEKWKHFKGGVYVVKDFVWDATGDDLKLCVVYAQDNGPVFLRTLDNFLAPLEDGPRFAPNG